MRHRWNKGKEGGDRLPNGEKIIFIKVGGRTSAVIPSVQKKTGPVSSGIKGEAEDEDDTAVEEKKPSKAKTGGKAIKKSDEDDEPPPPVAQKRGRKKAQPKYEESDDEDEVEAKPKKKQKVATNGSANKGAKRNAAPKIKEETPGKRRSTRNETG
jgi:hypothetical protein